MKLPLDQLRDDTVKGIRRMELQQILANTLAELERLDNEEEIGEVQTSIENQIDLILLHERNISCPN